MISSPHLAKTLMFYVSRRWSQYLNRCAAASAAEVEEAPGASVPFSPEPIMVEMEGGRYTGPIPPASLAELVAGRWPAGRTAPKERGGGGSGGVGGGSGGGGISGGGVSYRKTLPMVAASGGSA